MNYRFKPIKVDACQVPDRYRGIGATFMEFHDWAARHGFRNFKIAGKGSSEVLVFPHNRDESWGRADPGDWIVKFGDGEFLSYTPEDFGYIYEAVSETDKGADADDTTRQAT